MRFRSILYVDVGNTNLKWWLVVGGSLLQSGSVPSKVECLDGLSRALRSVISRQDIVLYRVCIASVKSADFTLVLAEQFSAVLKTSVYAVNVVSCLAGLTIAYAKPKTLGVDRWLGMHAAYSASTGYAIHISAGSAITVDVVDSGGQHLGGYIVPGVGMQRSMLNSTDRSATHGGHIDFSLEYGRSTQSCVDRGIAVMLTGFVSELKKSILLLRDVNALGVSIFVSGGDADALVSLLSVSHSAPGVYRVKPYPDAILDGLKSVCAHRESLVLLSSVRKQEGV